MSPLTVTPAQAAHLAALLRDAQTAHQRLREALTLLTLGQVPEGATLTDINTDTGVLSFRVEPAPDAE